jgi:hypothetical protein
MMMVTGRRLHHVAFYLHVGQLLAYLCQDYWTSGYPTKARECGQRALAIAESLQDFQLQVTGNLCLSAALILQGCERRLRHIAGLWRTALPGGTRGVRLRAGRAGRCWRTRARRWTPRQFGCD